VTVMGPPPPAGRRAAPGALEGTVAFWWWWVLRLWRAADPRAGTRRHRGVVDV